MTSPRVVIVGAGPAGLSAAFYLTRRGLPGVTVLEQGSRVGGIAGSFELAGMPVDYGSHRLHPACNPEVLREVQGLLKGDLLDQPRHGRIRLRDRWIHFPLRPLEMVVGIHPTVGFGIAADLLARFRPLRAPADRRESFATVLEAGLGSTICREFYFPYALKLWGLPPDELSATQARRRISSGSLPQMMRKVLQSVPGLKSSRRGRFFYPRGGFGQIFETLSRASQDAGADIRLNSPVTRLALADQGPHTVWYEEDGREVSLPADHLWLTLPLTAFVDRVDPSPPEDCLRAARSLEYRGMILIYLVLGQARFSEYDAHYFPGADIAITRLSEPKNYRSADRPADCTVLCAELPCDPDEANWSRSDEDLGQLACDSLAKAGIPITAPVRQVLTHRVREAYPKYRLGYEAHFERLDRYAAGIDRLLLFGRQALFAHDNAHHALHEGYCAAACLTADGEFDRARWRQFRRAFDAHVVED